MWCRKTFESPLDCKEIEQVNPKRNQPWIFILRMDTQAEAPILWPPNAKNQLNGKDPDAGKDWGQDEKEVTEDEMVGWHHWLNGHEFKQVKDREAWCAVVDGVIKSWTWFSNWTTAGCNWYSHSGEEYGVPLKAKNIATTCNFTPVIPLLSTYLEKTLTQKDTWTTVFMAALFTQARTWKKPSTNEWIKKIWYICIKIYYFIHKKNEIMSFSIT